MIYSKILYCFLACYLTTPSGVSEPPQSTIKLTVENIQKAKGHLMIAVYAGAANFLQDNQAVVQEKALVEKTGLFCIDLPNLPPDEYAIAVYHDVNNNQKLDTNIFGIPTEPYGFSNNARSKWGPPKYEVARFGLNESEKDLVIRVEKWSKQ
ncbi:MAG: DUF2141 domain-containing protein [Bacteroidota bacterium]